VEFNVRLPHVMLASVRNLEWFAGKKSRALMCVRASCCG
jgi:hypothetical protein